MKKIYMLGGKARSGKDTVASYIKEYYEDKNLKCIVLQISSSLKYYASKVLNWDGLEESKPREFLQHIGTEVIRKQVSKDFLINRTIDDIKILFNYVDIIVVSDVRLPDEFINIRNSFDNVTNILIRRNTFDNYLLNDENKHITEVALDEFNSYDELIENDGNLDDLKVKIIKILMEEVK